MFQTSRCKHKHQVESGAHRTCKACGAHIYTHGADTNHRTGCQRCKPGNPCLSHTILPFGTCWIENTDPFWKSHPNRRLHPTLPALVQSVRDPEIIKTKLGWVIHNGTRTLANIAKLTFDDVPLGYLDWLSAQDWLYGSLRKRLTKYLNHPAIKRELNELFPEDWDDSRQPAFMAQANGQHREPMPKEILDEAPRPMTYSQAWRFVADLFLLFEATPDFDETPALDTRKIRAAVSFLPAQVKTELRTAFKSWQDRIAQNFDRHVLQLELVEHFNAAWPSIIKRATKNAKARARREIAHWR